MIKYSKPWLVIALILSAILISAENAWTQETNQLRLVAEKQRSGRVVSFTVGMRVSFETVSSRKLNSTQITAITDSTISFENKKHEKITIRQQDLVALSIRGSDVIVDLEGLFTQYNLKHVSINLRDGKRVSGRWISNTSDSIAIQRHRAVIKIRYSEVESIGIHRKGRGALGALIGGLTGAGIGALIGTTDDGGGPNSLGKSFSVAGGAVFGLLIGAPIGAAIGSSNKKYPIKGDLEKFRTLMEMINRKAWTLKVSRVDH